MADLETPVSAFLRAAWGRARVLSAGIGRGRRAGGPLHLHRPHALQAHRGARPRDRHHRGPQDHPHCKATSSPCCATRSAATSRRGCRGCRPFTAGAVGFFAYDAVRQIERLPARAKDELGVPDACLLFFDEVLAFDHVRKEIWLVVTADVTRGKPPPPTIAPSSGSTSWKSAWPSRCPNCELAKPRKPGKLKVKHRTAKKDFLAAVARTKEYIARRRRLPGGPLAALRRGARRGQLPGLSRAAHRQSQPLHVLPALCAGGAAGRSALASRRAPPKRSKGSETRPRAGRLVAGAAGARSPGQGRVPAHRRARGRAAPPKPRTTRWPKRCCTTKRSAPST